MAIELQLLVWSVALAFAQMLVAVSGATLEVGLPELAGNREPAPETTGWAGRARRAHLNMLESLVLFAALVLTAVIAQKTNSTTALGAENLLLGAPHLRAHLCGRHSLGAHSRWGISVIGLVMIFSQVV